MPERQPNITELLRAAASGQRRDLDSLMNAIYADLRQLAESQLRSERGNHTLQPTALVHEAYLKLIDQRTANWRDRSHFFAIAARVIRRILVDHARRKAAAKHGHGLQQVSLDTIDIAMDQSPIDFLALDQALDELAGMDARQSELVELRFFGGMTLDEVAASMNLPERTVDRLWAAARAWLFVRLADHREQA